MQELETEILWLRNQNRTLGSSKRSLQISNETLEADYKIISDMYKRSEDDQKRLADQVTKARDILKKIRDNHIRAKAAAYGPCINFVRQSCTKNKVTVIQQAFVFSNTSKNNLTLLTSE